MKLADFRKLVAMIPTDYDNYDVATTSCGGNYDIEQYVADIADKVITFEP